MWVENPSKTNGCWRESIQTGEVGPDSLGEFTGFVHNPYFVQ